MRNPVSERGTSLIETMFAMLISMLAMVCLGGAIVQVGAMDKNQGQEATRATIYAQDKMEALLALSFKSCTQAAGVQPASCNTTGNSSAGWTQGLLSGGELEPFQLECPSGGASVGYVDYLDTSGLQMTGSSCSSLTSSTGSGLGYVRQWWIRDLPSSGPAMKQISVAVYAVRQVRGNQEQPLAVLTSVLSQ